MKLPRRSPGIELTVILLFASVVSLILYAAAVQRAGQLIFTYLPWNLVLAWIPFGLAVLLMRLLKTQPWSNWTTLIVTLLWLVFLPNSFYMVTDFIHLSAAFPEDLVTDTVLFSSFVFTGLLVGYSSLYLVHRALRRRLSAWWSVGVVAAVLAACSLAIYIGRDLRWNSWDVLTNPAGLLFDVSDRLVHPSEYGAILSMGLSFFVFLLGMYVVMWRLFALGARRND